MTDFDVNTIPPLISALLSFLAAVMVWKNGRDSATRGANTAAELKFQTSELQYQTNKLQDIHANVGAVEQKIEQKTADILAEQEKVVEVIKQNGNSKEHK